MTSASALRLRQSAKLTGARLVEVLRAGVERAEAPAAREIALDHVAQPRLQLRFALEWRDRDRNLGAAAAGDLDGELGLRGACRREEQAGEECTESSVQGVGYSCVAGLYRPVRGGLMANCVGTRRHVGECGQLACLNLSRRSRRKTSALAGSGSGEDLRIARSMRRRSTRLPLELRELDALNLAGRKQQDVELRLGVAREVGWQHDVRLDLGADLIRPGGDYARVGGRYGHALRRGGRAAFGAAPDSSRASWSCIRLRSAACSSRRRCSADSLSLRSCSAFALSSSSRFFFAASLLALLLLGLLLALLLLLERDVRLRLRLRLGLGLRLGSGSGFGSGLRRATGAAAAWRRGASTAGSLSQSSAMTGSGCFCASGRRRTRTAKKQRARRPPARPTRSFPDRGAGSPARATSLPSAPA